VDERGADTYWGKQSGLTCTYQGVINLKHVDWPQTIFARMHMDLGEEEFEIRFLKNAPIYIETVTVEGRNQQPDKEYTINDWRRC
jgi:hypothetical protein